MKSARKVVLFISLWLGFTFASERIGQVAFQPSEVNLKALIFEKEIGLDDVNPLHGPHTSETLFTRYWHEYDWKIAGEYRLRHTNTKGEVFWREYKSNFGNNINDRLSKSRKLETRRLLIKYGKIYPRETVNFLLSHWMKSDSSFANYEIDLLPIIILEILDDKNLIDEFNQNQDALEKFLMSDRIREVWKVSPLNRK